jgi:exodeoxyribonuclease VII small subunit
MTELAVIVAWKAEEIATLPYEQARESLDVVVSALEDAEVPLEDLMKLWEIGERLAAACEAQLTRAKARLDAAQPQPE